MRRSAVVDYAALNLFTAVARIALADTAPATLSQLEEIPGVVELLRVERRPEVLAVVVFERLSDRVALERRVEEFSRVLDWLPIEERRTRAAAVTFHSFARAAAVRERLQAPP